MNLLEIGEIIYYKTKNNKRDLIQHITIKKPSKISEGFVFI